MNLYGELLNSPQLRFNYSSPAARDAWNRRGLARFGPYDSTLFPKDRVEAVVLYPTGSKREHDLLINGLTVGEGNFGGFQQLFKIPIHFIDHISFGTEQDLGSHLDHIASLPHPPDIVFALLQRRESDTYVSCKSRLLANGIPSQMILVNKLNDPRGRQYVLENLALASYAKVGGTPWTIAAPSPDEEVVLGVSRARDASMRYYVGYVVLFTRDGDFLFVSSKAPVVEWDDYVKGLSGMVESAIRQFEEERGAPSSIVVHFHKNPGRREIEAITQGLQNAAQDMPFAIVHLNEFSNFRLFDVRQSSYIPPAGLKVNLSQTEALLLLDGLRNGRRRRMGVPRVLDIRLDSRSTMAYDEFPRLVQQVNDLAHVNWRGFNAAAVPITISYSRLIARMLVEIGINAWNEIVSEGRLRHKAWFL